MFNCNNLFGNISSIKHSSLSITGKETKSLKRNTKKKGKKKDGQTKDGKKGSKETKRKRVDPIQAYLKRFKAIEPRTDCTAPPLALETYYERANIVDDVQRLQQITRENMYLLMNINKIQRSKGSLDTYNPYAGKRATTNAPRLAELNNIEVRNIDLYRRIKEAKSAVPSTKELNEMWKKDVETILKSINTPPCLPALMPKTDPTKGEIWRPRVFLELSIKNGQKLGTLLISLYLESAPCTVANFIALCENSKYVLSDGKKKRNQLPNLVGSPFHRIFCGLYAEGGDIVKGNGTSGKSTFDKDFSPENLDIEHNYVGTLAMLPTASGKVHSQFTISFKPLPLLKGRRQAFGRVIDGFQVLESLEDCGSKFGKPTDQIIISRCGLLKQNY